MKEALNLVLLIMLPHLSQSAVEIPASDLLILCDQTDSQCKSFAKTIKETMSPALILEICKSPHANVERTCYIIIERALEIGAELPVDYLKEECFGSSLKKRTICRDITTKCEKYPKSDSCSKIIPQNQTISIAIQQYMLEACGISEDACRYTAEAEAKNAKRMDVMGICEIDDPAGKLACRHIIRETIRIDGELKVQDWKNKCLHQSGIFCEEVVSACDEPEKSGNKAFCEKLAEARDEIKNENLMRPTPTMKLVIIVSAVVFAMLVVNGGICVFRKKIFKSYYNNKKGGMIKQKKKNNGKGSVANSEISSESVHSSQQQQSRKESDVLSAK